jgi:hypothetical protein
MSVLLNSFLIVWFTDIRLFFVFLLNPIRFRSVITVSYLWIQIRNRLLSDPLEICREIIWYSDQFTSLDINEL